jgi:copper(I)-binding protein
MWRIVNMPKKIFFVVLVLLVFAGCTGIFGTPDIRVSYPKAAHSAMVENTISIFMFIENKGGGDDYLVSARVVELPDKRVELHDVVDGKMTRIEKLKIPAGEVVELRGGSYHIMVFDVTETVSEVTVALNFEKSGAVEVEVKVPQEAGKMEGM